MEKVVRKGFKSRIGLLSITKYSNISATLVVSLRGYIMKLFPRAVPQSHLIKSM